MLKTQVRPKEVEEQAPLGSNYRQLCSACRKIDIKSHFLPELFGFNGRLRRSQSLSLGTIDELCERDNCALCRLVLTALHWAPRNRTQDNFLIENIALSSDTTLRHLRAPTLEDLVIYVDHTSRSPGNPCKRMANGCPQLETFGRCRGHYIGKITKLWENYPHFHKFMRTEQGYTAPGGPQMSVHLLRHWLRECEGEHGSACSGHLKEKDRQEFRLILIDVAKKQLLEVQSCHKYRYLALSYVWGSVSVFQTTTANYASLRQEGSLALLEDQIPRVIQDAMALVTILGEKYLWVDALCIVQDDAASKHIQLANMDLVYREAVVTIVAASGRNANSVLPGVSPGSRLSSASKIHGVFLALKPPQLDRALLNTVYNNRAWTMQESILSKRRLYFFEQQVYFQCNRGTEFEVIKGVDNDLVKLNSLVKLGKKDWITSFEVYTVLVSEYTRRLLSYPQDILNAFSGIQRIFESRCGSGFLFALPEAVFDIALLWTPVGKIVRRKSTASGHGHPGYRFPSWSWAGWVGQVEYKAIAEMSLCAKRFNLIRLYRESATYVFFKSYIDSFKVCNPDGQHSVQRRRDLGWWALSRVGRPSPPISLAQTWRLETPILLFEAAAVSSVHFVLDDKWNWMNGTRTPYKSFCQILDANGRHCGVLFEELRSPLLKNAMQGSCDFVRMSHFLDFRQLEGDIKVVKFFDESFFECRRWCLVYVLLVKWKGDYAERLCLGQVHIDAWKATPALEKLIKLA